MNLISDAVKQWLKHQPQKQTYKLGEDFLINGKQMVKANESRGSKQRSKRHTEDIEGEQTRTLLPFWSDF